MPSKNPNKNLKSLSLIAVLIVVITFGVTYSIYTLPQILATSRIGNNTYPSYAAAIASGIEDWVSLIPGWVGYHAPGTSVGGGGSGGVGVGGSGGGSQILPGIPATGLLLGVHVSPKDPQTEINALETQIGRKFAIDSEYYDWKDLSNSTNNQLVKWDLQNGMLPMFSWRPLLVKNGNDNTKDTCASAKDILSGKYDTQIKQQANGLKQYKVPVLLRWNYEMTDNEYNYCFNNAQQVKTNIAQSGATYVAVWKYIHDIFVAQGATNVQWVWAPSANIYSNKDGSIDTATWKLFYPGNSYVDWIADDQYNKTDTPESYATDVNIAHFYSQMAPLGKPLMQSETAANADPAQNPDPQTKWLSTIRTAMDTQYPAFHALIYWNANSSAYQKNPKGVNYLLIGQGLATFKQMAQDPHFTTMAQLPQ